MKINQLMAEIGGQLYTLTRYAGLKQDGSDSTVQINHQRGNELPVMTDRELRDFARCVRLMRLPK